MTIGPGRADVLQRRRAQDRLPDGIQQRKPRSTRVVQHRAGQLALGFADKIILNKEDDYNFKGPYFIPAFTAISKRLTGPRLRIIEVSGQLARPISHP